MEDSENPVTIDGGNEDINMRMQELDEQRQRPHQLGEVAQGMIANSEKYSQLMQVRLSMRNGWNK